MPAFQSQPNLLTLEQYEKLSEDKRKSKRLRGNSII